MKVITLALGALVATSAAVYLTVGDGNDEADLVAPRTAQPVERMVVTPVEPAAPVPAMAANPDALAKADESLTELLSKERDPDAATAKTNLFRALESPPVVAAPVVAPVVVAPPPPPVAPNPTFVFLGSFREGAELNAIVQDGEKVEFVKPNQIIAGYRVDSIDANAINWTHERTATKGLLRARVAK